MGRYFKCKQIFPREDQSCQNFLIITVVALHYSGATVMQKWGTGHVKYCLCRVMPTLFQKAASSWTRSWPHSGHLLYGTQRQGICIFPGWEIPKMLLCRLLLNPVLPHSSSEAFKECGSWIFSSPGKFCGCIPVISAREKQDSSHPIFDLSASFVENLHLLHSL